MRHSRKLAQLTSAGHDDDSGQRGTSHMTHRIDAHQHFWELREPFDHRWLVENPKLARIQRNYLPEDLAPLIRSVGIDRTVFIQTQHMTDENDWVLKLADQYEFIAGVVGWVDLAGAECEQQLTAVMDHPKFVGVRHVTHDEPDDDFIVRPDVLRGLAVLEQHGIPFDLLFFTRHLRHAARLAEQLPNLKMVIDHLSKPPMKARTMEDWLPDFRRASTYPNLYCKISGMVTEADWQQWKVNDLRPYVEQAIELFGPERCMFGSDWPVCEVAGSYEAVFHAAQECLAGLSTAEQNDVFGGTATRFYALGPE
jgi:L-fuconolactonase